MADPEDGVTPFELPIDGTLDLHAFAPGDTRAVVRDYVEAAVERGLDEVRVIHGRGAGVQRGLVQATLDAHPLVASFADDPSSHLGATLVRLHRGPGPETDR